VGFSNIVCKEIVQTKNVIITLATIRKKEKQMTNKKWAVLLVLISIPISYYGFSNFEKGVVEPFEAILISVACTGGIACFFSGLYLFFTKEKGRGEDLLASQTKVGYSPISLALNETPEDFKDSSTNLRNTSHPLVSGGVVEKTINKKVNEMAKAKTTKDTHVADSVKEFREIGQSMKDGATRRANIRARLKEMGIAIDEDGKIDV
jgi:hypothetical protein